MSSKPGSGNSSRRSSTVSDVPTEAAQLSPQDEVSKLEDEKRKLEGELKPRAGETPINPGFIKSMDKALSEGVRSESYFNKLSTFASLKKAEQKLLVEKSFLERKEEHDKEVTENKKVIEALKLKKAKLEAETRTRKTNFRNATEEVLVVPKEAHGMTLEEFDQKKEELQRKSTSLVSTPLENAFHADNIKKMESYVATNDALKRAEARAEELSLAAQRLDEKKAHLKKEGVITHDKTVDRVVKEIQEKRRRRSKSNLSREEQIFARQIEEDKSHRARQERGVLDKELEDKAFRYYDTKAALREVEKRLEVARKKEDHRDQQRGVSAVKKENLDQQRGTSAVNEEWDFVDGDDMKMIEKAEAQKDAVEHYSKDHASKGIFATKWTFKKLEDEVLEIDGVERLKQKNSLIKEEIYKDYLEKAGESALKGLEGKKLKRAKELLETRKQERAAGKVADFHHKPTNGQSFENSFSKLFADTQKESGVSAKTASPTPRTQRGPGVSQGRTGGG